MQMSRLNVCPRLAAVLSSITVSIVLGSGSPAEEAQQWLPPEEEIPEEVLRTELILEGRSPIDGSLMSPEDYAALEAELQQRQTAPLPVDSELQSLVFQLKLLNLLKSVFPFL